MIHLEFNKLIFEVWEKYFQEEGDDIYAPLMYPPLKQDCLLFIGSNPSFSLRGFKSFLANTEYADVNPHAFWLWKNRDSFDFEKAIEMERLAKEKYSYFKKVKELSKSANLDWEHIDLFFFRETNQSEFKKRIISKNKISEFGVDQINLAKYLISKIQPKIIVVINAFASDMFKEQYELKFDEKVGYYKLNLEGKIVPVFLGSMLSGQRAMDKYSYERLRWQIIKAVKTLQS